MLAATHTTGPGRGQVASLVIGALLLAAAGPAAEPRLVDLDPGRMPYEPQLVHSVDFRDEDGDHRNGRAIWLDIDGDGDLEHIRQFKNRLSCKDGTTGFGLADLWDTPLPAHLALGRRQLYLQAVHGLLPDGVPAVVLTARHRDGDLWELWRLDPRDGSATPVSTLDPVARQRRDDGHWDGRYVPVGALALPDRPHPLIVVCCQVGHDAYGRGLLAVDPVTGEVVWRHEIGAKIQWDSVSIADLDTDGWPEIVATANGTDNLHGERVGLASDDSSHVLMFDHRGALRWRHALLPHPSSGTHRLIDLDGDGRREVLTVAANSRLPRARLDLWSLDGHAVVHHETDGSITAWEALARPAADAVDMALVAGSSRLERWRLTRGGFTRQLAVRFGPQLLNVVTADCLPEDGPELVVGVVGRGLAITDWQFEPLALIETSRRLSGQPARGWRVTTGEPPLLAATATGSGLYRFARRPADHAAWYYAGGATALLAVAALALSRRRRRRTTPGILRDLRRQLLERLATTNHGKFGLARAVETLTWEVETALMTGSRTPELGTAHTAVRDDTLPRLQDLRDLAASCALPDATVAPLSRVVDDLAGIGAALTDLGTGTDGRRLHGQLQRAHDDLARELANLRDAARATFTADTGTILGSVLQSYRDQVTVTGAELDDLPVTRIDPDDLVFVFENLVGNATRAMSGQDDRTLTITWACRDDHLTVAFADRGPGVPPELRSRIFEEGFSTAGSSGIGLFRSRQFVRRFGGDLVHDEARTGRGARFVVSLRCRGPAVRDRASA